MIDKGDYQKTFDKLILVWRDFQIQILFFFYHMDKKNVKVAHFKITKKPTINKENVYVILR